MRKNLRLILTLAVLVVFAIYFFFNLNKFRLLAHTNFYLLLVIALAEFISLAASGLFTKIILKPFGKSIGILESFYVSLISSVGNFFAPAGAGFAFRAAYLKKRHGLSYSDYVATLYGNYIIVFLVASFLGLLSLYLLHSKHSSEFFTLVMIFGGIFFVSLLLTLVKIPSRLLERDISNKYVNKIAKIFFQILDGWNGIVANKKLLAKLALLTMASFAVTIFISKVEIVALHLSISFPALLLFSVLGSLSLFVSLTPANLGVKEAIFLFSSSVIGFSVPQILAIALIDRGVLFLVLVVLWLVTSRTRLSGTSISTLNAADSN